MDFGDYKQILPLVRIRLSHISNRRLVEITEPARACRFADIDLRPSQPLAAKRRRDLSSPRVKIAAQNAGHDKRRTPAELADRAISFRRDAHHRAAIDGEHRLYGVKEAAQSCHLLIW